MKRREVFKKGLGAGALIGLTAVSQAATAQGTRTLRLASPDPAQADAFATLLGTASGGTLFVETEQVDNVQAADQIDRLNAGEVDMALIDLHRLIDRNIAFALFDGMPFGLSATEVDAWIYAADGRDILDSLGAEVGVSIHLMADRGASPMWSRAPLTSVDEMIGLRIGSRGLGIRSLRAIGAEAVSDLNQSPDGWLDLDVLDGIGAAEVEAKGLAETFPYATRVNPNKPSSLTALVVSDRVAGTFSEAEQTLLSRACNASFALSQANALHANSSALSTYGDAVTTYDLPDEIWSGLQSGAQQVLAEIFESGSDQAAISDGYVFFITDIARWSYIGEASFYAGRKRLNAL